MRASGAWKKSVMILPIAVVVGVLGACSGDGSSGEQQSRSASVETAIKPIKRVNCPERTSTQKFMGKLTVRLMPAALRDKLWLLSSEVDCDQWSGKSNPTKLAKVGPVGEYSREFPGIKNPFRLEVGSASRPQWRMTMATKNPDGTFRKLFSFKLTFAPFPKRPGYRGLFLCFTNSCDDVTRVKECPSTDPKNIDCGFPPGAPFQVRQSPSIWQQDGGSYRTPALDGSAPFLVETSTRASEAEGGFEINISEVRELG